MTLVERSPCCLAFWCGVAARRLSRKSLGDAGEILYMNCDLPVTERSFAGPGVFFKNCENLLMIFDEIHQLSDPSRILKSGRIYSRILKYWPRDPPRLPPARNSATH